MREARHIGRSATRRGRTANVSVLAVSAVLAASALAGCGDLSRAELGRGVKSLSALAATGRLVAGGEARDDSKQTYVRVMSRSLGGEAQHEAEKLADATPAPDDRAERDQAVAIAMEISGLLSQLQTFAGHRQVGRDVRAALQHEQAKADRLAAQLGVTQ